MEFASAINIVKVRHKSDNPTNRFLKHILKKTHDLISGNANVNDMRLALQRQDYFHNSSFQNATLIANTIG